MTSFPENPPITDEAMNSYVDGALSSDEAAHIARCAATDPKIANRIAMLHQLKAGVAGIADDVVVIDPPMLATPAPRQRHAHVAVGALAVTASLALSLFWFASPADGPVDLATDRPIVASTESTLERFIVRHDAWIGMAEQAVATHSFGYWLDDLMGATGLRLVYHALLPTGDAAQAQQFAFVGPNGCRLSLFESASPSATSAALNIAIDGGLLTARWAEAGRDYALVARNMDRTRFATISTVVHDASRDRGSVDAQALANLRQARQPCLS